MGDPQAQRDPARRLREFGRIVEEIGEHLRKACSIAVHDDRIIRQLDRELSLGFGAIEAAPDVRS